VFPRGKLGGDDHSYEGKVGGYVKHIYGEKELGGTQMLKLSGVAFEKVGMPTLPDRSYAATSETMQHTLYGGLVLPLLFLGGLSYIAKRNVKADEGEDQKKENPDV
jgi:hypothetical protein